MKRKLLLIFLTIISAVCLCLGISACEMLEDFTSSASSSSSTTSSSSYSSSTTSSSDSSSSTEQSSSSSSSSTEQSSSSSSSSTEQSSSSSNSSTEQSSSSSSSSNEQSSSSSSSSSEQSSSSSSSSTEQSSSSSSSSSEQSSSTESSSSEQSSSTESSSSEQSSSSESSSSDSSSGTSGGEEASSFTARAGNSTYGYSQLASETNGTAMQSIYYQMYTACETFTTNTEDITLTNGYYTISEISYSSSLTTNEAVSVWKVFYSENPMYYWLSNSCVYSSTTLYLCIDETYASYTARAAYDTAITTMVTEASTLVAQQGTELEKAMAIHDYIISKIDYAYQSDGKTPETAIWAHNITGVSSMGYGVCEAYSKTYLALCLINGLDCVIATGYATSSGEAHAWNLVEIDGVWYGVDCTWDDTGDASNLSYTYFGMNASTINSTRTTGTTTYGSDYLYNLPEVTAYGIQLVTLFKGETELGIYVNVDAAFAAMTDSTADYTIELYFYNTSGVKVETSPSVTVYIYSTSTPAVNSVTINGIYTDLGDNTFYISYLSFVNKCTLKCNLQINDAIVYTTELDLGDYTLTTGGTYCQLNGTIYDSKTTDTVSIKSTISYQTVINATLNISYYYGGASVNSTAVIGTYYGSDMLVVYGTVTISKYIAAIDTNYYNIYLENSSSLSVANIVCDSENSRNNAYILFQFDSLAKYPTLYLGDVDTPVYLFVNGYVDSSAATPTDITCAIATLGDANDFTNNIYIYFSGVDKTDLFTVNSDNEIVYKAN